MPRMLLAPYLFDVCKGIQAAILARELYFKLVFHFLKPSQLSIACPAADMQGRRGTNVAAPAAAAQDVSGLSSCSRQRGGWDVSLCTRTSPGE